MLPRVKIRGFRTWVSTLVRRYFLVRHGAPAHQTKDRRAARTLWCAASRIPKAAHQKRRTKTAGFLAIFGGRKRGLKPFGAPGGLAHQKVVR